MNITKEKLEQILSNDLLFKEEIEKKQGFILDCFSKHNISIPIEKLLPFINKSYVVLFVLEHYKLNDEQIKSIKHFLKEDSKNHLEFSNIDLNDIEKNAILKKQNQLPTHTNISLDFFYANFNLIIKKLYNVNKDYDEEGYDNDSTIENIIKKTFKTITDEDFLNKKNLLKFSKHPFLFRYIPENLLFNKEIKEHYKKIIFKHAKKNNLELNLSFFRRYKFDEKDIDDVKLLKELLSKEEHTRYEHYSSYQYIHNFEKIIPLEDYVLNYNLNEFFKLPLKTAQDNKKLIQSFLLSDKSLLYDFDYEYLIYLECSNDIFDTIFDVEFIKEICTKTKNIKHHYAEYLNSPERKRRNRFFNEAILISLFKNQKLLNKTDFFNVKHFFDELPEDFNEPAYKELKNFVFFVAADYYLKSNKIINYGSDNIIQALSKKDLQKLSNEKPSFNLLFLLYLQQENKRNYNEDYLEIIKHLSTLFEDSFIEKILKKLSIENLPKNKLITSTIQNNFIYEALQDFNKINPLKKYYSLSYSKEVQNYILKNNIILENNLVLHLIDDKHDFLIDYINHNKEHIIKNTFLLKKLNNNPNTFKLIKDFNIDYKEQFEKVISALNNNLTADDREDQTINELLALIPHNELLKQINELFINNDFKTLKNILSYINEFEGINSNIYENISKLEFNSLILNLDNDDFISIIKEVFDNKNTFKKFSNTENLVISEKLLEKGVKYDFILDIFENNTDFFSDFLMKNFPFDVLTQKTHKLSARDGAIKTFSNKLIIQGLESISQQNLNVLQSGDINSRVYDFLLANFKDNKKQFLDLLKTIKNKNPEYYVIMGNQMILSSLSKDKRGEEEEAGKIFFENFDLDFFLNGVSNIISKTLSNFKENPYESKININFIHNILNQPIYLSYYETSYSSNYEKHSIANREQTEKIIDFYIKNAPTYIFTSSVIGTEKNPTDYLIENLDKYNNIDLIEKIIFNYPINKTEKIEGAYYEKAFEKFFEALINHSVKTNNQESLNYLTYLFDSLQKQKDNLNYNVEDRIHNNILEYLNKSDSFQEKFSILQTKQILTTSFFEKNTVKIKKIRM